MKGLLIMLVALACVMSAGFSLTTVLWPDQDGLYSQWTSVGECSGFSCVNSENVVDYVAASTPGLVSSYTFNDINPGLGVAQINNVRVYYRAKRMTPTAPCMTPFLRLTGSEYYSPVVCPSTISWGLVPVIYRVNPQTGMLWTIQDVNNLEAGMGSVMGTGGSVGVAAVYAVVTYSV